MRNSRVRSGTRAREVIRLRVLLPVDGRGATFSEYASTGVRACGPGATAPPAGRADRPVVAVVRDMVDGDVDGHGGFRPFNAGSASTSSVHTLKLSACSDRRWWRWRRRSVRPRAISTRPMRGMLLRASKVARCRRGRLEPSREVHHPQGGSVPMSPVSRAVARRNVEATARRDRQMRVVAARAPGRR